ncbi:MAG: TetR/AcrR family transcriptional regulator [Deltaproteobacteria bacterium]|nr:TetR/AcrR family transcriptional regulator [Deltaproteobacteria bacterium]
MDQSSGGAAAQRAARTTAAGESILTKGERTAQRILDVAEQLFAEKGFEGTTLREIAAQVGIREPGLYNHFASKDVLYRSVLERGLQPLADAIDELLERDASPRELEELPANLTDLLALQPNIVALMHRNLLSSAQTPGRELMDDWLERLFLKGAAVFEQVGRGGADQQERALWMLAMFNLTTSYFLTQRIYARIAGDDILSEENLARQKRLVTRVYRGLLAR